MKQVYMAVWYFTMSAFSCAKTRASWLVCMCLLNFVLCVCSLRVIGVVFRMKV